MIFEDNETNPETHPSHEDFAQTADGIASPWMRERVLEHTDSCERCRFVLAELARNSDEIEDCALPEKLTHPIHLEVIVECPSCKAKVSSNETRCPACGSDLSQAESKPEEQKHSSARPWRRQGDTFFFWIAGCMLLLSFMLPKYYMHFLATGAFFGILAIIDYSHRNIFAPLVRAWREGDEDKVAEVLDQLRERFKIG